MAVPRGTGHCCAFPWTGRPKQMTRQQNGNRNNGVLFEFLFWAARASLRADLSIYLLRRTFSNWQWYVCIWLTALHTLTALKTSHRNTKKNKTKQKTKQKKHVSIQFKNRRDLRILSQLQFWTTAAACWTPYGYENIWLIGRIIFHSFWQQGRDWFGLSLNSVHPGI